MSVSPLTDEGGMSVEELSARTGAPVRTIREYQTWRVLHPPARVGRRGFYDASHVRRLERIAHLQERGYSIAAIRDLFDAWAQGAALRDVLGVDDAVGLAADEAPVALTGAQFAELLPAVAGSARLTARAVGTGMVTVEGTGFIARSPALVQLVADAIDAGLSPTSALELARAVVAAADTVAEHAALDIAAVAGTGDGRRVEALVRRGRVLLARAVATHTIAQVGHHLTRQAQSEPALGRLLESVRIGSVARSSPTPKTRRAGRRPPG
jgi:DNA-binding transcriptional MerR regulator